MVEPAEPTLEVGRIVKPHGLRGEVLVSFTSDVAERRAVGAVFSTDRGDLVLEACSRHQSKWIVKFAGIGDRNEAEDWRGTVLSAEATGSDDDTLWVHELIGCEVVEPDGTSRGRVDAVQANPASDLLVLDTGALVPLRFVVGTPHEGTVLVDVPDGLFELYEE